MNALYMTAFIWIAMHLGTSNLGLRDKLMARYGRKNYDRFYSLASLIALSLLIFSYSQVGPSKTLWTVPNFVKHVAYIPILASLVFLVGAFVSPNPTIVGQTHKFAKIGDGHGLIRVTRHPFLWSVALWSSTHLIVSGTLSAAVFFGALAFVSLVGTISLDRKKASHLGKTWSDFTAVTSNVPFLAIFQGRNRFRLNELWLTISLGLILFVAFIWGHPIISGVNIA